MAKNYILAIATLLLSALGLKAQVVTTEPTPLQEDSKDVAVYFHADRGDKGLMGAGPETRVFAHTGACLSNGNDWQYAPTWGDNLPKYELEYVSPNLWKLNIGDIRTYYGVKPTETVTKLAFVFRNADNSRTGRADGGADIYVDVLDSGLQISLSSSVVGNLVRDPEATFTLTATEAADLEIEINGTVVGETKNSTQLTVDYKFGDYGSYTVTGRAVKGDQRVETTETYLYPRTSPQEDYPGGVPVMGAVKQADGSVIFCLAAPQKSSAIIVGSWNGYEPTDASVMSRCDYEGATYFWVRVDGLEQDKMYPYYYYVDGSYRVGDPYARLVLDPWNDKYISPEVFPDLPAYPEDKVQGVPLAVYHDPSQTYAWEVEDFKGAAPSDLIIYELLLRDFTGTEGEARGDGTVNSALARLPYLKQLGVNAIELLPINEFNGNISWGYNPNFYFAPDKAYGTPDDYKRLIDACHKEGIAVILDIVFNQTDGLHPWYQLYPAGQNPFYNMDAPHAYSVLNDWNQGYPLVQKQFKDVLQYWMKEYKVDGYRFDLVKGLGDNDSYSNSGDAATNAYNASRVARMRELQKAMEEVNPDAYFINENLAGEKEENEMAAFGQLNWANYNNAGCQYAMGYSSSSDLAGMYAPDGSRTWGSTVSYLESHDEQRLAYRQNIDGAVGVRGNLAASMGRLGSAAMQMILAPGAHMIWQFSELGNFDNTKNASGGNNTDPKTVRWNLYDNATRRGLHDSYASLIRLRNRNPELFAQDAQFSSACRSSNWAAGRTMVCRKGDKELIAVANPNISGDPLTVSVSFSSANDANYYIASKTYNSEPSFSASAGTVTVAPNSYVVVVSDAVLGVDDVIREDTASAIMAYGTQGELVVDSAPAGTRIVAADGRSVAITDGSQMRLALQPGIYLLSSGKDSLKVLVK